MCSGTAIYIFSANTPLKKIRRKELQNLQYFKLKKYLSTDLKTSSDKHDDRVQK